MLLYKVYINPIKGNVPLTVGGANKASLIASKNSNRDSHVSGSIILDVRDKSCNVLKTR